MCLFVLLIVFIVLLFFKEAFFPKQLALGHCGSYLYACSGGLSFVVGVVCLLYFVHFTGGGSWAEDRRYVPSRFKAAVFWCRFFQESIAAKV